MSRLICAALVLLGLAQPLLAVDGNRLTYLDEFCDPYYPHRDFPKLTTPQWVGDQDVECVVVLAIDDMRDPEKYETYLRPILDRLKQIDGRAPVSIMTNQVDPRHERLQQWLKEGLSLEVHTFDHPCPCLQGGDFAKAKGTYDKCVDLMHTIPGNKPVAFRMPCCDSLNTPSPRFWMEAFNKTTPAGNYLSIDSSVFNIITSNDQSLPKEITLNDQGEERFRRYVPFKSFVNTIEDYPYPYVIGKLCWQFPCVVPSDWSAQHVQKPNNPDTVRDLKLALDACVIKQGVYNLVFHPHGWIRNEQIVELIDHAVSKHGKKVKFLNFRECEERLTKNLLAGQALRLNLSKARENIDPLEDPPQHRQNGDMDNGVRVLDVNHDGYMDVVIGNDALQRTRIWNPREEQWVEGAFPDTFDPRGPRFGVFLKNGHASLIATNSKAYHFAESEWQEAKEISKGIPSRSISGYPSSKPRVDVGLRLRDLDQDGVCEMVFGGWPNARYLRWNADKGTWSDEWIAFPENVAIVSEGQDVGLRFIDLDGDDDQDIVYANENYFGVHLFESIERGWSKGVMSGKSKDGNPFPLLTVGKRTSDPFGYESTNNGAWFHSKHLWWQNEDTNRLPDHVDRRSFAQLLGKEEKTGQVENLPHITPTDRKSAEGQEATDERIKAMGEAKSPEEALKSIVVKKGFKVELVACEPLIVDPVAFDWGPDGRLWVVEMRDYPRGIDDKGKPGGRVKVLADKDGDGRYDEAKLFLDDLPYPTGIKVWRKGCIVSAAPEVLYAEDTDDDGKADKRETLLKGFGEGNQQHRVNGLRWGLDGWLYLGNGDSGGKITSLKTKTEIDISGRDLRFKPDTGELDPISGQTQFSLCFDDFGNRFGGNNSNPVWHYVLEDYHLRRNPHVKPPQVRHQISVTPGNAPIFPLSKTVTRFNDYQTANRFTSACGIEIYRDKYLGEEYYGNVFVCEPVHNLVHREIVKPDGVTFTSQRAPDEKESEFLASTDNWFRPVMARTGPDGALYIADMYRLVIEHPTWIPEDWQRKLNLRAGEDKGRIYRVVREDEPPPTLPSLEKLTTTELVAEFGKTTSGTRYDALREQIIWRGDRKAGEQLRELLHNADARLTVQVLSTLAGLRAIERRDIRLVFDRNDAHSLPLAIDLAAQYFPVGEELEAPIIRFASHDDARVRMHAALALYSWPGESVAAALTQLAQREGSNEHMLAAVLSSVDKEKIDSGFGDTINVDQAGSETLREQWRRLLRHHGNSRLLSARLEAIVAADGKRSDEQRIRELTEVLEDVGAPFTLRFQEETLTKVRRLMDHAQAIVIDPKREPVARVDACRLLFFQDDWLYSEKDHRRNYGFLKAVLSEDSPEELRKTAWQGVRESHSLPFDQLLYERWIDRPQTYRLALLDALLANNNATPTLLKLLDGKRLSPGDLDATRAQALANHPDKKVQQLASQLTRTITITDRADLVARFEDVLKMRGDVARGRAAFRKRCTACHQQEGEGRQIGPDLVALTDKSSRSLLVAMLDPNRAVEAKFIEHLVVTEGGQLLSGVVISETGTSVTLIGSDGKEHTILRNEIDVLRSNKKSLMPEGLERDLTKQDFADVIAYLQATATPAKNFPGNQPSLVKANEAGELVLAATQARVYGPKLVYETKYQNLGFWQSPDDVAEWSLEVPASGKYRVTFDYACDAAAAGDTLQLSIGGQSLLFKVISTGTWDDYQQQAIGTIELEAGPAEASVRSSGAIRSALIDLRAVRLMPVK